MARVPERTRCLLRLRPHATLALRQTWLAPQARSILLGLARDCFEKRADHNVEALRATKWAEIFSPGATQLLYELPNMP